jgi:hypothetical protein
MVAYTIDDGGTEASAHYTYDEDGVLGPLIRVNW